MRLKTMQAGGERAGVESVHEVTAESPCVIILMTSSSHGTTDDVIVAVIVKTEDQDPKVAQSEAW